MNSSTLFNFTTTEPFAINCNETYKVHQSKSGNSSYSEQWMSLKLMIGPALKTIFFHIYFVDFALGIFYHMFIDHRLSSLTEMAPALAFRVSITYEDKDCILKSYSFFKLFVKFIEGPYFSYLSHNNKINSVIMQ